MSASKKEMVNGLKRYKAVVRAWERYGKVAVDNNKKVDAMRRREEVALAGLARELKLAAEAFYSSYTRLQKLEASTYAHKKSKPTKET